MINIHYPVKCAVQSVTEAEFDLVHNINHIVDRRVIAIKFIRQQYGLGLKEAKDVCDTIGSMPACSTY